LAYIVNPAADATLDMTRETDPQRTRVIRACRTVGNARKGPSSVRWVTFAILAAHISRADNVLRNDSVGHCQVV